MKKVSKKEPLISVIVPVYKVEKYLNRCVKSIINQSYKNLEIILVDDGSPDMCGKICDDYGKKDKRIKVIHKENAGVSSARNEGIKIAKGDYISFVDSDDWIDKNMYKILYENLIKFNADISCCKELVTSSKNNCINCKKYNGETVVYTQEEYMKKFFKIGTQECVYYIWNKLYRKEIVKKIQFSSELIIAEDTLALYEMLLNSKKIVETNYPYYYYYYNNSGITKTNFSEKDLNLITAWDRIVSLSESNEKYKEMAIINRKRINYTLLMRMAQQCKISEINNNYLNEKTIMLSELKKDLKLLLRSKIPISRKITMLCICINYDLFVKACGLIRIIRR